MTIHSVPLSSSYAFRKWLGTKAKPTKKQFDFIARLEKDKLSPFSVGPRQPTVLINYVLRQIERGIGSYTPDDIDTITKLWFKFVEYREKQPLVDQLTKLHGEFSGER